MMLRRPYARRVAAIAAGMLLLTCSDVSSAAVTEQAKLCTYSAPQQVCDTVTEYSIPRPPDYSINPGGIAAGPDGRMWFTENAGSAPGIGAITTSGTVTQYATPTSGSHPGAIVSGPDGRMWFSEDSAHAIGAITTAGTFSEYPLPPDPNTANISDGYYSVAAGSDGRIWFIGHRSSEVGAMTTTGQVALYGVPVNAADGSAGSSPYSDMTAGPDHRMWFIDQSTSAIDAITVDGTVSSYPVTGDLIDPIHLTAGPDGRIWVTAPNGLGAITTDGVVTSYRGFAPASCGCAGSIAPGADHRLWFFNSSGTVAAAVTTQGVFYGDFNYPGQPPHGYGIGGVGSAVLGISAGPDGRIWFTDQYPTDRIGALTLPSAQLGSGTGPGAGTGGSGGGTRCVVPGLTGVKLPKARRLLRQAHCQLGRVKFKTTRRGAGRILSQNPRRGTRHRRGSRVSVLISVKRKHA